MAADPPRREDRLVPLVPGRHAHRGRRARSGIESREGAQGAVQRIRGLRGRLQPEPPVARRRRGRREERTAGRAAAGRDGHARERPRRGLVARRNPHRVQRDVEAAPLLRRHVGHLSRGPRPRQRRPPGRRARGSGPEPALLSRRHAARVRDLPRPAVLLLRERPHCERERRGRPEEARHEARGRRRPHAEVRRGRVPPRLVEDRDPLPRPAAGPFGSLPARPGDGVDRARHARRTCSSGTPASHRTATSSRSPHPTRRASRRSSSRRRRPDPSRRGSSRT